MKHYLLILLLLATTLVTAAPPPFSEVVRAGNLLFISGQLADDSKGNLVSGGFIPEMQQTMSNLEKVLKENNASMADIVSCTVFLTDIKDRPKMNTIYGKYFTAGHYPARTTVAVSSLALDAHVEISCIASVK